MEARHRGFLPGVKNCLKSPSAARSLPVASHPLPPDHRPYRIPCILQHSGHLPVANHPLPPDHRPYRIPCILQHSGHLPVASHPLPPDHRPYRIPCILQGSGNFPVASHPLPPDHRPYRIPCILQHIRVCVPTYASKFELTLELAFQTLVIKYFGSTLV